MTLTKSQESCKNIAFDNLVAKFMRKAAVIIYKDEEKNRPTIDTSAYASAFDALMKDTENPVRDLAVLVAKAWGSTGDIISSDREAAAAWMTVSWLADIIENKEE